LVLVVVGLIFRSGQTAPGILAAAGSVGSATKGVVVAFVLELIIIMSVATKKNKTINTQRGKYSSIENGMEKGAFGNQIKSAFKSAGFKE